jgi:hypothetical protein
MPEPRELGSHFAALQAVEHQDIHTARLTSIDRMPAHAPHPDLVLESCIGTPEWWLRRPAGAGILQ